MYIAVSQHIKLFSRPNFQFIIQTNNQMQKHSTYWPVFLPSLAHPLPPILSCHFPALHTSTLKKEAVCSSSHLLPQWKCQGVFISSVILILYLPVAAAGYFVYGEAVDSNIVLSVKNTTFVMAANMLLAVHLILAFLIIINPVCQELEEIFQVPLRKYEQLLHL